MTDCLRKNHSVDWSVREALARMRAPSGWC
ncbi:MAG: hypothetical protein AB1593_03870 [Pseudomonadota bacterium]